MSFCSVAFKHYMTVRYAYVDMTLTIILPVTLSRIQGKIIDMFRVSVKTLLAFIRCCLSEFWNHAWCSVELHMFSLISVILTPFSRSQESLKNLWELLCLVLNVGWLVFLFVVFVVTWIVCGTGSNIHVCLKRGKMCFACPSHLFLCLLMNMDH